MGRRIEVELTSTRDDGLWTWRAAGARQPKGELLADLLYDGAKVGDVVKVEAEFHVDGIEITEVFAPKQKKERSNLLEMKTRQFRDDELVSTQRVSRDDRRGARRDRDDRSRRRPRNEGSRERAPRPEVEARPKPKRLRPRRVHRDALLAEVGDEHRPIIEQVMKDGMPGVRAAIDRQNSEAKEAGKPAIEAAPILAIAEKNLSKARLAEWRDRADAALATVADLDLRDLRSVVVAGSDVARDQETRELADKLKTALDERVESDHATWLADLESAIGDGRVVRALRLSSRPVKAGAPLPPELATKLATQASEALAPDVGQDRWATVLDALAFSPVRSAVTPVGVPTEPKSELLDAVKRLADRISSIAELFGVDPATVPRSAKRRRPPRNDGAKPRGQGAAKAKNAPDSAPAADKSPAKPTPEAKPTDAPAPTDQATADTPTTDAPTPADQATPDTPTTDAPAPADQATPDAPTPADASATEAETADAPASADQATADTPEPVTDTPTTETKATDTPASADQATPDAPEPVTDAPTTEAKAAEAPASADQATPNAPAAAADNPTANAPEPADQATPDAPAAAADNPTANAPEPADQATADAPAPAPADDVTPQASAAGATAAASTGDTSTGDTSTGDTSTGDTSTGAAEAATGGESTARPAEPIEAKREVEESDAVSS